MAIGTDGPSITIHHEAQGTDTARAANQRFADSIDSSAKCMQVGVATAAALANQMLELAGKAHGAAVAIIEYARAGTQANSIQARFDQLSMGMDRFTAATMRAVDGTTLQTLAMQAMSEKGLQLTADEFANLGRLAAAGSAKIGKSVTEVLTELVNLGTGTMDALGIFVDETAEAFEGLTAVQVKSQIAQELVAQGAQVLDEALDSEWLTIQRMDTAWANLESTMQQTVAKYLDKVGAIDAIADAIDDLNETAGKCSDELDLLSSALTDIVETQLTALLAPLEIFTSDMEVLVGSIGAVTTVLSTTFKIMSYGAAPLLGLIDGYEWLTEETEDATEATKDFGDELAKLPKSTMANVLELAKKDIQAREDAEKEATERAAEYAKTHFEERLERQAADEDAAQRRSEEGQRARVARDAELERTRAENVLATREWLLTSLGELETRRAAEEQLQWDQRLFQGELFYDRMSQKAEKAFGGFRKRWSERRKLKRAEEAGEDAMLATLLDGTRQLTLAAAEGIGWRSHLEAAFKFAEGVYYAVMPGMQVQAVGAFTSAALHVANAALAGGGGGPAGGGGTASAGAVAAPREPMTPFGGFRSAEEGPRESLYLVVDERVLGEVSIASINRSSRYGSGSRIQSTLIGGSQESFS